MKIVALTSVLTIFSSVLFGQNYALTDTGSAITFSIKNFGLAVNGTFTGLKGTALFNPSNLSASFVNASVDVATINTGTGSRDKHLKKEEYFYLEKYPRISFVSTRMANAAAAGTFTMEGNINIKGVTKTISFPFTALIREEGYLFMGEFKLDRRDFGVGGKSLVMADNLTVSLSVLAKKAR